MSDQPYPPGYPHENPSWWCITHQRAEPDQPGDYKACFECGHVFRTQDELVEAENVTWRIPGRAATGHQLPLVTSGDEIYSCPYCTHDW